MLVQNISRHAATGDDHFYVEHAYGKQEEVLKLFGPGRRVMSLWQSGLLAIGR